MQSHSHYDQLINPALSHGGEGRLIRKHFKAELQQISRREGSVPQGRRCAVCSGYCGRMRYLDHGHVTYDKVDVCDLEGHLLSRSIRIVNWNAWKVLAWETLGFGRSIAS